MVALGEHRRDESLPPNSVLNNSGIREMGSERLGDEPILFGRRGCLNHQKEELQPQMDADEREFEVGSHASIHEFPVSQPSLPWRLGGEIISNGWGL